VNFEVKVKVNDDNVKEIILSSLSNSNRFDNEKCILFNVSGKNGASEKVLLSMNQAEELSISIRLLLDVMAIAQAKKLIIKNEID
jgi:hypothetical protein